MSLRCLSFASFVHLTSKFPLGLTVIAFLAAGLLQAQTDISPDTPYGVAGGSAPEWTGGRIHTLLIDPTNNTTLYAASTTAGVWKSTDAGHSWFQASMGINNPFMPFRNEVMALDSNNPKRLLLATEGDDGRVPQLSGTTSVVPYGGLYVSTDGAATWRHAQGSGTIGGLCPGTAANGEIYSVAFSSGQPFVAAACGLFTNLDPGLGDGNWVPLPKVPFDITTAILAPNSYGDVLFVCTGKDAQLYRSQTLGQSWDTQTISPPPATNPPTSYGNVCAGLSVVPEQEFAPDTVAMVYSYLTPPNPPNGTTAHWDVNILSFGSSPQIELGFNAVSSQGGGGTANVFAVRRASSPQSDNRPGFGYDVYAADGWYFYLYVAGSASTPVAWKPLQGSAVLHADSWSMAFPTNYDPANSICTAFASDDGGVFSNASSQQNSSGAGCDPSGGWVAAMSGLHTLEGYGMKGVAASGCAGAANCPSVYLANGDNDTWIATNSGVGSGLLGDTMGDSGDLKVDPAFSNIVVSTRGPQCTKLSWGAASPPGPGAPNVNVSVGALSLQNCPGINVTHESFGPPDGFLTQVMALRNEAASGPLYYAAWSPPNQPADAIAKLSVSASNPSSAWNSTTGSPWSSATVGTASSFFSGTNGRVARIQSTGGIKSPVLWVGTTTGQLYTAVTVNGQVGASTASSWKQVPGLGHVTSFFVNPYDSKYMWAQDSSDSTIYAGITTATGTTWTKVDALTKMATNNGEFRFGCGDANTQYMLQWTCSLAWMSFSRNHPNVVVAALYPGAVAYSPDYGTTWNLAYGLTLDSLTPEANRNVFGLPIAVWFDDGVDSNQPAIYIAVHGRGVIRVGVPNPPPPPTNCSATIVTCGNEATLLCDPVPSGNTLFFGARDQSLQPIPAFHPGAASSPLPTPKPGPDIVYDAPLSPDDNQFEACDIDPAFHRNCVWPIPFVGPDSAGCPGHPKPPPPTPAQCRKEGCQPNPQGGCLCQ
ncbi:MAG TPA: hypothetical protein VMU26_04785 [Candidatus Polarisedimenticolia bacterium]|nr:hypothetical protein [Candidatus Polarisedimenticolia bacterium]